MPETGSTSPQRGDSPVFGFILFGGPISGALLRDLRLANELARRGYEVHLWWAMDKSREVHVEAGMTQHWLMHGYRHYPSLLGGWATRGMRDAIGRAITALTGDIRRANFVQKRPGVLGKTVQGLLRAIGAGIERDRPLISRFSRQLDEAGVTHLLPMLAVFCPIVQKAIERTRQPIEYLVTFQGYELYLNYASQIGYEQTFHQLFSQAVADSRYPAIAVSEDYRQRVLDEIGLDESAVVAIPPGVELPEQRDRAEAHRELAVRFRDRDFDPELPLVTYVGRQDSEKGIDLLLYAAAILQRRGLAVQLAVVGPTLFDSRYGQVCKQIARNLRLPVVFGRQVSNNHRLRLMAASRCVVYPSIHREPFGMVAAESASLGTPAVVPDYGGVAGAIEANGKQAGLTFEVWDSGSLAEAIQKLIEDEALWRQLHEAGPAVADHYSVPNLANRVLTHLGLNASRSMAGQPPIHTGREQTNTDF